MKRRSIAMLVALTASLAVGPVASAEPATVLDSSSVAKGEYNSYVVIMKADPLVTTDGDRLTSTKAKNRGQALKASHRETLKDANVSASRVTNDYVSALNGFSVLVNHESAVRLAAHKDVALVLPDELLQPQTDESGDFLGLTGGGNAYSSGITGKGVVVGVIDTGIWPEHPSFSDNGLPAPGGVNGPIPCEFGNTGTVAGHHNTNDAAFTCQDKLVGARQMLATYRAVIGAAADEFDSARDDDGHGSHTASTSAGNSGVQAVIYGANVGDGTLSGVAPQASIIAYKGLGNLGGFTSDLAAAIDQAVADGVDVINYSIGGGGGTLSADDIAFLFANDAGVFVAASVGNSGPGAGTIGSPGDNPWLVGVGASTQDRFLAGTVELGNGATYEGASITNPTPGSGLFPLVDGATLGNEFCQSAVPFSASIAGKMVLCKRGVNARVDKSLAVTNGGGVGTIHFEASDQGNLFTDTHWGPTVHIDNTPGLAIKNYIAANPGTATAKIRNTRAISTWPLAPSMTQFSSRGPAAWADVLKPDVTAPGLQILAAASPFPGAGVVPGQLFQAIAGTSMSSPHVAGLLALLKQANPGWSASAAKSALMTTAHQNVLDNDRVTAADPFDMGAGHVRPGSPNHKGSSFQPGLVYDAGINDYLAWICGARPANISAGTCSALAGSGYSLDPSDLNLASIAIGEVAGTQTVTRTVTSVAKENGWRTYTPTIDAPAGYTVSVSPSSFSLKKGMSATFQVTITNQSAPIGAWRFGALTWNDNTGHYTARSPIAVRGSQFNAPTAVQGSGVSGSGSIDVSFGYTGDYDAAAFGLVAANVIADTVDQDPNATFAPSDVGNGATAHTLTIANSQLLRIRMPPDAVSDGDVVDLDLFLYDPSNVLVASSTSGGTDETISVNNPAAGNWTLYVHGWAVTQADEPYTAYVWSIPASPPDAGSLVITGEPANATIGTVGQINYSWSGATAGQWHFGAIQHLTGATIMGRTLIEIDNR